MVICEGMRNAKRKKRLADWLEKMSAAFMVGSVLTDKGPVVCFAFGAICLAISMVLTDKGESND